MLLDAARKAAEDALRNMALPQGGDVDRGAVIDLANDLKALEAMARKPFDVVVSDMMMPGMDGAELLMRVAQKYPQTVRIILSIVFTQTTPRRWWYTATKAWI